MRLLALQAYDTASHRAFLEGWIRHSRHSFDKLALPGRHFKWRMRQAPIQFAQEINAQAQDNEPYDALWCTSMLDLATLRGLCPAAAALPAAVYFHENQLVYPTRYADKRDVHFGLTQMTAAVAAIASHPLDRAPCIWWNSAYNRDSFLEALEALLTKMPDHRPMHVIDTIRRCSAIHYPGIDRIDRVAHARSQPPLLLWAARWEYDKGPELFFEALELLEQRGVDFRLSVIGQRFREQPACFDLARERFAKRIVRWGYQANRADYVAALQEADIVVSTADHEFFGLAIAEAVCNGCFPVLPNALAYPEVWGEHAIYHDDTPAGVADAIGRAIASPYATNHSMRADRFAWPTVAARLDDAVDLLKPTP